jgi:hypothetical protein
MAGVPVGAVGPILEVDSGSGSGSGSESGSGRRPKKRRSLAEQLPPRGQGGRDESPLPPAVYSSARNKLALTLVLNVIIILVAVETPQVQWLSLPPP